MKTMALILPPELEEDGSLCPAQAGLLRRLVQAWQGMYRVTVILRAVRDKTYRDVPEGVEVLLDDASADADAYPGGTYMQRGLAAWRDAPALPGGWDCVIALDGLHPWCLMTALHRVKAARRLAFLPVEPRLFLCAGDMPAFGGAFGQLDGVLCASRWTQEDFAAMFLEVQSVLAHPPHEPPAEAATADPEPGALHVLTVEPLEAWRHAERIPPLAAEAKAACPRLRWHIFGSGPRQPYLLRDVILYDVCGEVFPEGAAENADALLPLCSGVVHFDDENTGVAAKAQALGIPVLSLRRDEGAETLLPWLASLHPAESPRQPVWPDGALWTNMIEGE